MCHFNFCFNSRSFLGSSTSLDNIYKNIENLSILREKITDKSFSETLFRQNDIYEQDIYNGHKLYEILYENVSEFRTEYKQMLALIIDRANEYDNTQIDKYIGLNTMDNEDIIYNVDDWINFHYDNMKDISSNSQFLKCINIYFKKLKFHNNIAETLETLNGGLVLFSSSIVQSLIYLENDLNSCILNSDSLSKALQEFSTKLGLEVTLEGNMDRKVELTFTFLKNDGTNIDICCEPHIKLSNSSMNGNGKHYYNRIYFYQGRSDVEEGKVLVGHIGRHL